MMIITLLSGIHFLILFEKGQEKSSIKFGDVVVSTTKLNPIVNINSWFVLGNKKMSKLTWFYMVT